MKRHGMQAVVVLAMASLLIDVMIVGCESASYQIRTDSTATTAPGVTPTNDSIDQTAGPYTTKDDEVWVIVKSHDGSASGSTTKPTEEHDEWPGSGAMVATLPDARQTVPLPLERTEVKAGVAGYIATVDVAQRFANPFREKIEAVYVFPLPRNAAVNDFVMTIGTRRIRGIVRDKAEARRIYAQAKRQGYRASIMTQQRPNIFTQKVANIEPGRRIDVKVRYFHTLRYDDGWYTFVFPMVVGPRYNPAGSTDSIGALSRRAMIEHARRQRDDGEGTAGLQGTAVAYLRPGERSGHDIALTVDIDAGVMIEDLVSVNHRIHTQRTDDERRVRVTLDDRDQIANRDFVLRYRVAGRTLKTAMMTWRDPTDPDDGYFTLMVYPPGQLTGLERVPMEMIFVLDCSGSMRGAPLEQSKDAVRRALGRLRRDDRFQVIRFSNDASQLGRHPLAATADNLRRAARYLDSLSGQGGTRMLSGIKAALDYDHDRQAMRFVCFLTDGYIGNEASILNEMDRRIDDSRVFSFGVGSSPNRFLMHRMAKIGRGAEAFVSLNDDAGRVMDRFFDRVSHPAMTDVHIDFGAMRVREVYPRRLPDLFVGRPVIVTGRFSGHGRTTVRVTGRAGDKDIEMGMTVDTDRAEARHQAIAPIWARRKIAELNDELALTGRDALRRQIRQVALNYNLVSDDTAFVAVDSSHKTAGQYGVTVHQAVPVPAGVRYDTTVTK